MAGRGGPKERGPKRRREKDDKGWQKRGKRKYCQFCKDKTRVDYKDVMTLRKFVSDRGKMGSFAIPRGVSVLAWGVAGLIVALNLKLLYDTFSGWF